MRDPSALDLMAPAAQSARGARERGAPLLQGATLALARAGWLAVTALVAGLLVVAIPLERQAAGTVCAAHTCVGLFLTPEQGRALARLGVPLDAFAAYITALDLAVAVGFGAVAGLLFWRRSDERMALLSALTLVTFGPTTFTATLGNLAVRQPLWAWPVACLGFLGALGFTLFLYLFPDGRFVPSWARWVLSPWVLLQGAHFFLRGMGVDYATWPVGLGIGAFVAGIGPALAIVLYRYRRVSRPAQREQTKWVVLGVTVALGTFVCVVIGYDGLASPAARQDPLLEAAVLTVIDAAMLLIPLSIGVAILRYRLWNIDLLISRTLVYAALSGCVVGLYVLVVGILSMLFAARGGALVSLVATGLVAVAFQPLRAWVQGGVNRLLYGERDDPYKVLSQLGQRLGATPAPDGVLPAFVETVRHALKLPYVAVTVSPAEGSGVEASAGVPGGEAQRVPLVYQGETVGELLLGRRGAGEEFGPADRRLLDDLARQGGSAVSAVRLHTRALRLAADLQQARTRLVAAREEERRRIRRDLHDGLGPTLAGLTLRVDAARNLLAHDPAAADKVLVDLKARTQGAIADIRRLVYDLRPPALDDLGLLSAVRAQARHHDTDGVSVVVQAPESLPALPAAVEVAAYRIVQEALTNVVRHAHARTCWVGLAYDGALHVVVADDGRGLPPHRRSGVGLTSMRERAEELGGSCLIEPRPDGGTRVRATLPCAAAGSATEAPAQAATAPEGEG